MNVHLNAQLNVHLNFLLNMLKLAITFSQGGGGWVGVGCSILHD